jgi:hypothetical protein
MVRPGSDEFSFILRAGSRGNRALKVLGKVTDIDLSEATLIEGMSPRRDPFESCGAKKRTYEKSTS